jgi:hypothetical protein
LAEQGAVAVVGQLVQDSSSAAVAGHPVEATLAGQIEFEAVSVLILYFQLIVLVLSAARQSAAEIRELRRLLFLSPVESAAVVPLEVVSVLKVFVPRVSV